MRLFNIEFLEHVLFVRILFCMVIRILQVCVCVSSDLKKMKLLNIEIGLNVLFVRIGFCMASRLLQGLCLSSDDQLVRLLNNQFLEHVLYG